MAMVPRPLSADERDGGGGRTERQERHDPAVEGIGSRGDRRGDFLQL